MAPEQCVLILDSYPDAAETLAFALRQLGLKSLFATSAEDALAMATSAKPTALLIDFDFQGGSIKQFCERVRDLAPGISIIAVSGWTDKAHFELALKCGFDHYLFKPATIESVRQALGGISAIAKR